MLAEVGQEVVSCIIPAVGSDVIEQGLDGAVPGKVGVVNDGGDLCRAVQEFMEVSVGFGATHVIELFVGFG